MKDIKIVIGANFGDEGKGLMTNYFSSKPNTIVVCSNGGAQRGHTVFEPTTDTRHVFHHFGSGTLNEADTYLPKYYILNPIVFNQEYEELSKCVENFNVYINPACMITTPLDMMANQIKEQFRGNNRHGSCGTGIFETITRYKAGVTALNYDIISEYYTEKFKKENIQLPKEWAATFYDKNIFKMFIEYDYPLMRQRTIVTSDDILKEYDNIVFEAGQGLLLDQNNTAYFPHLTPSNTGIKNPAKIINSVNWEEEIKVETCYVSRTYLTRHGAGPFKTECWKEEINPAIHDKTNEPNSWQGTLRYGFLNIKDMIDRCYNDFKSVNINNNMLSVAFTHLNEYNIDLSSVKLCLDNCNVHHKGLYLSKEEPNVEYLKLGKNVNNEYQSYSGNCKSARNRNNCRNQRNHSRICAVSNL